MADDEHLPTDATSEAPATPERQETTGRKHRRLAERFHAQRQRGGKKFLLLGALVIGVGVLVGVGGHYGLSAEAETARQVVFSLAGVIVALGIVGLLVGMARSG